LIRPVFLNSDLFYFHSVLALIHVDITGPCGASVLS
jgi:hypothetical protein